MNPRASRQAHAFTRTDLAAVLATGTLLAGLLVTTAGVDRGGAATTACRSNLRRLMTAWSLYTADNRDNVPLNGASFVPGQNWCDAGFLSYDASPANWDFRPLTNSQLGRIVSEPGPWHCPDDIATVPSPEGRRRRIRSYSMNAQLGVTGFSGWAVNMRTFPRLADINAGLGASRTLAILDEHPGSINDGSFAIASDGFPSTPSLYRLVDIPGSHHRAAGNLSFCDGHVETWKWRDARTRPAAVDGQYLALNIPANGNTDVARIQSVSLVPTR